MACRLILIYWWPSYWYCSDLLRATHARPRLTWLPGPTTVVRRVDGGVLVMIDVRCCCWVLLNSICSIYPIHSVLLPLCYSIQAIQAVFPLTLQNTFTATDDIVVRTLIVVNEHYDRYLIGAWWLLKEADCSLVFILLEKKLLLLVVVGCGNGRNWAFPSDTTRQVGHCPLPVAPTTTLPWPTRCSCGLATSSQY